VAEIMRRGGCWVLEVDIQELLDTVKHEHLAGVSQKRVRDGVMFVPSASGSGGVMEDGAMHYPREGIPRGSDIAACEQHLPAMKVLRRLVRARGASRLDGEAVLNPFGGDYVIVFTHEPGCAPGTGCAAEATSVKYGLALHEEKTRLVDFRRPSQEWRQVGYLRLPWFTLIMACLRGQTG